MWIKNSTTLEMPQGRRIGAFTHINAGICYEDFSQCVDFLAHISTVKMYVDPDAESQLFAHSWKKTFLP